MTDTMDSVKCIRRTKDTSWCGKSIAIEWAFESPKHALAEAERGGRLVPCPACLKAGAEGEIVDYLARTLSDEDLAEIDEADGFDPTEYELIDFEYITADDLQFWRTPRGKAVLERARQIGRRFGEDATGTESRR